jgi:hypothetical protein
MFRASAGFYGLAKTATTKKSFREDSEAGKVNQKERCLMKKNEVHK